MGERPDTPVTACLKLLGHDRCIFSWDRQHGTMHKTKHRGRDHLLGDFLLKLIGYNLVRIPKLVAA